MPSFQHLGKALADLRKERKWTQRQVEVATGVMGSRISEYENHKSSPELETLEKLLTFYRCSLARLERNMELIAAQRELGEAPVVVPEGPVHPTIAALAPLLLQAVTTVEATRSLNGAELQVLRPLAEVLARLPAFFSSPAMTDENARKNPVLDKKN